mgnify:CR=1 FL=1
MEFVAYELNGNTANSRDRWLGKSGKFDARTKEETAFFVSEDAARAAMDKAPKTAGGLNGVGRASFWWEQIRHS